MPKIKLIVRFKGGLGNQLFIFFYAQYLKRKYDCIAYYDKHSGFKRDFRYNRDFSLNKVIDLNSLHFLPVIGYNLDLIYVKFFKIIGSNNYLSRKFKILYLNDANCNTDISNYKLVFLDGYFQNIQFGLESSKEIGKFLLSEKEYSTDERLTLHVRFYDDNKYDPALIVDLINKYIIAEKLTNLEKFLISEKGKNRELILLLEENLGFRHIELESDIDEFNFLQNSYHILTIQSSFSITAGLLRRIRFADKKLTKVHFPLISLINDFPDNWLTFNK